MKKLIAALLTLTLLCVALVSCSSKPADDTQLRIGYLTGPTGIGMAKLINDNKDNTEKYTYDVYFLQF